MAQEIRGSASLSIETDGSRLDTGTISFVFDQAQKEKTFISQVIGTSPEAIAVPSDFGSLGACLLYNSSSDGIITLSVVENSVERTIGVLYPRKQNVHQAYLGMATSALRAAVNSGTAKIEGIIGDGG